MPSLFISHSSEDRPVAEALTRRLAAEGLRSYFLDVDPEQGIRVGRSWERELYTELRRADAVLYLSSASSDVSRWCFAELALARSAGTPVFPVLLDGGGNHPLLRDTQYARIADDGFTRLVADLQQELGWRAGLSWDQRRSPYPGLEAFGEEDAAMFFGRDAEIGRLRQMLRPRLASSGGRLTVVIGPSGSGKSSLVRAGLLPLLRRHGSWVVLPPLVPGFRPLRAVARVVVRGFAERGVPATREQVATRLTPGTTSLIQLAEDLCDASDGEASRVLLFVDQAEELVTLAAPPDRSDMVDVLRAMLGSEDSPWHLLVTLRSEFLSEVLEHGGLADVLGETLFVGPLDRARLHEVVERPAARAGLQLAPGLVGRMVEDTVGGGALPLLAYTLRQLHDRVGDRASISHDDYDEVGGVVGALRQRADAVLRELTSLGRGDLVLPTLSRLATVDGEQQPTRRRERLAVLDPAEREVVTAFVDARLLTTDGSGDEAVVEVAHEALLRAWPPLLEAIEERRSDLAQRAELERLADEWLRAGRPDSYLVREDRLARMRQWVDTHPGLAAAMPAVGEFVARSERRDRATVERDAEVLARRVLDGFDDPELGVLLAIAAVTRYAPTSTAVLALDVALASLRVRCVLRGHDQAVNSVAWSPDGSRLLTALHDGTVRIWDALTGAEQARRPSPPGRRGAPVQATSAAWSPDGGRILATFANETACVWQAETGELQLTVDAGAGWVHCGAWSPDGRFFATTSNSSTVLVWDANTGRQLHALEGHDGSVAGAAWSPDGARILTTTSAPRLWDAADGRELLRLEGHERPVPGALWSAIDVRGLAWSPDGARVATSSAEGLVRIWDATDGGQVGILRGHEGLVRTVSWAADGRWIASGGEDRTVRLWRAPESNARHEKDLPLHGHADAVTSVAWAPTSSQVASASNDGTVRIWSTQSQREWQFLDLGTARPFSLTWSRGERRLLCLWDADGERVAAVWDRHAGRFVFDSRGRVRRFVHAWWAPDGNRVAFAGWGEVCIWDVDADQEVLSLPGDGDTPALPAWSPDGSRLAVIREAGAVWITDAITGARLFTLTGHEVAGDSLAWSPDGRRLAMPSRDGSVRTWDADTGTAIALLPGHGDATPIVNWAPDSSRVITTTTEAECRIWDSFTGEMLTRLGGAAPCGWYGAWWLGSERVLTLAARMVPHRADADLGVWDVASGSLLLRLGSDREPVRLAARSADGTRFVTVARDRLGRLWDAASGRQVAAWATLLSEDLQAEAWSADLREAAFHLGDGTIRFWDMSVDVDTILGWAAQRVTRELTNAERQQFGLLDEPSTGHEVSPGKTEP